MSDKSVSYQKTFSLDVIDSFEEAESIWRTLEASGDAFVFQTYDWQFAYFQAIGCKQVSQLCLVIVKAVDDRPIMLLPFGIIRWSFSRTLIWLGGSLTDYNAPVLASGAAELFDQRRIEALWQQLCEELPHFDYTDFQRQPAQIGAQTNPFLQLGTRVNPLFGTQARLTSDWNEYYRAKRSGDTRRKERKKEARLAEFGPIEFTVAQTEHEINAIVAALVAQKSASYTQKGVRSLFRDAACVDFIKAYTLAHSERGLVILAAVKVRGEIIATQWGLIQGDHFYCLMLSRDHGRFARYSPGNILLRRLLAWCCERGIKIFDFTYGDEAFKNHWSDSKIDLYDSFLPVTIRGSLTVHALGLLNRTRRSVRRSSSVHAFATTVRKHWYNTRLETWLSDKLRRSGGFCASRPVEPKTLSKWNK